MSWRDRLESAANDLKQKGAELGGEQIEKYWPDIQTALRQRVAPAIAQGLETDELVSRAAKLLHACLPLPIRLVLRQDRLTKWCMDNRGRVLAALKEK
jgi:hypothetical protein